MTKKVKNSKIYWKILTSSVLQARPTNAFRGIDSIAWQQNGSFPNILSVAVHWKSMILAWRQGYAFNDEGGRHLNFRGGGSWSGSSWDRQGERLLILRTHSCGGGLP